LQTPDHTASVSDPRAELDTFYSALARPADAADLLRRMHRAAREQGLTLDQANYRPVADTEGKFTRYQILLPAKGSYPEIRRFLVQVSADMPGLAVDSVNFQRQQVGDTQVDAQIRLTLFLGTQS
jgi:Tfp pilus assembly protein PilO